MTVYIVDGNNLEAYLAQEGVLRAADDVRLIAWLQRWLAGRRRKRGKHPRVLVVFDPGARGKQLKSGGDLATRIAPEGVTADEVILQEVRRLRRKKEKQQPVVVVTSDRQLAEQVEMLGADVLDCAQFAEHVEPPMKEPEEGAAAKMAASRKLGRSLDGLFLSEKDRASARKSSPSRVQVSPRKVSRLRDPSRLANLFREGDRVIRRRALFALGRIKEDSGRKLAEQALLGDPVPSVRAAAALALGQIADARSLAALEQAVGDRFSLVRASVATALSAYGSPETQRLLDELQRDSSRRVRKAARVASHRD